MGRKLGVAGILLASSTATATGQPDRPDPNGILAGVSWSYPQANNGPNLAFYATNDLPAACVNNQLYPGTRCSLDWPGLNARTGPDAVMGQWPWLVRGVRDVGINASSLPNFANSTLMSRATLAMTVADVLADRIAIASNGTINVTLSAQQLLDCANWTTAGYSGSDYALDSVLQYTIDVGLVPEACYAYNLSAAGACRIASPATPGEVVACPTNELVCNHTGTQGHPFAARVDCNVTDPWLCEQVANCCYDYSDAPQSPRCFKPWVGPNPAPPKGQCASINILERVSCGAYGVSEQECLDSSCCYDDSKPGTYFCFHPPVPVPPARVSHTATFHKAVSFSSDFPDSSNPYMAELSLNGPIIGPRININVGGGWPIENFGIQNYCEGYVCVSADEDECQEFIGSYYGDCATTAPVGGAGNEPSTQFWSKIVGYSSGCDQWSWDDCHASPGQIYYIHQNYFGKGWGVSGYMRGYAANGGCDSNEQGQTQNCKYYALYAEGQHSPRPNVLSPGRSDTGGGLARRRTRGRGKSGTRRRRAHEAGSERRHGKYSSSYQDHDSYNYSSSSSSRQRRQQPIPWPEKHVPSVHNNTCAGTGNVCGNFVNQTVLSPDQIKCCPNLYGVDSCTEWHQPTCCSAAPPLDGQSTKPFYCPGPGDFATAPYGFVCCANWTKTFEFTISNGCGVRCKPGTKPPHESCYVDGDPCPAATSPP